MGKTMRLGSVAGLPISVHWSAVGVIWLLTWNLSAAVLPEWAPGYSELTYWATGLLGALIFFGSLLAHEVAHAVVARRSGVEVKELTLWLLGGVADLGSEPPTPQADLRIAAAGPLTSVGLSVAFGTTAFLAGLLPVPDVIVALAAWLGVINLVLAVFNLIPGAPLDGGRVLRALLWRRHGNWARAATTAAKAGQTLGHGLIWLGVLELLVFGLGGLWLILVGWFVLNASRDEYSYAVAHHILRDVKVRDVMAQPVRTAPGWVTVEHLVDRYLLYRPHSVYPVEGLGGDVIGLVTLRQVRNLPADRRSSTLVTDVAVPLDRVPTATPDEPLTAAMDRSATDPETGGRFLVFDGHQLVGIVTPVDIARAIDVRTVRSSGEPLRPQELETQR